MGWTTGNPDVRDEKMSYIALFEVEGELNARVNIHSEEDQTVYISAYSYDA